MLNHLSRINVLTFTVNEILLLHCYNIAKYLYTLHSTGLYSSLYYSVQYMFQEIWDIIKDL